LRRLILDVFATCDAVRRDNDQLPNTLFRIAQEIETILSPAMLVEQNLSIFPLRKSEPGA